MGTTAIPARIIKYVVSGAISFGVENGSFLFLFYAWQVNVAVANVLSIAVALLVNFALNKYFVFNNASSSLKTRHQFARYVPLVSFNVLVSTLLVSALVHWRVPGFIAKPSVTLVVASWTYLAYKRFIFASAD